LLSGAMLATFLPQQLAQLPHDLALFDRQQPREPRPAHGAARYGPRQGREAEDGRGHAAKSFW
jgi:hypothetical protein